MNYTTIELGGKARPVRFSFAALYEYEKMTGRNAIADFSQISGSGSTSVSVAADLIFAGLVIGHKSAGAQVDFSVHDVADWAFGSPKVMEDFTAIFLASFPEQKSGGEGKKKAASPPGTN